LQAAQASAPDAIASLKTLFFQLFLWPSFPPPCWPNFPPPLTTSQ
jgi:hypothetical protein